MWRSMFSIASLLVIAAAWILAIGIGLVVVESTAVAAAPMQRRAAAAGLPDFWPPFAAKPVERPAVPRKAAKPARRETPPRTADRPAAEPKPSGPLPRPVFSEKEQQLATIPGFPGTRFWADSAGDYEEALPASRGDWLVLSSGAQDSAFGAGFLSGWSAAHGRPDYSVVIGNGTAAFAAVYAFAGPRYDEAMRALFTGIDAGDVFALRPTAESLVETWPFKRLIARRIGLDLLGDIAAEHAKGRRLFVLTTNLDAGRSVVWNMGAIAAIGGEAALNLFRDVLLAAASIPGICPPVYIEAEAKDRRFLEMHVDARVTGTFYVAPDAYIVAGGARLPMARLYLILNGKAVPEFASPERRLTSIRERSSAMAMVSAIRGQLAMVHQAARRDGVELNVAAMDPGFESVAQGAVSSRYMTKLFASGFEKGRRTRFLGEYRYLPTMSLLGGAGGADASK
ncbi:patatin [Rhodoplanes azumiensis]|uniref:Patatin n=1 Tax=Rhodoplanes azumiensis TaxID=1897628 RepID=A0ABW5ARJ0_9BRAD